MQLCIFFLIKGKIVNFQVLKKHVSNLKCNLYIFFSHQGINYNHLEWKTKRQFFWSNPPLSANCASGCCSWPAWPRLAAAHGRPGHGWLLLVAGPATAGCCSWPARPRLAVAHGQPGHCWLLLAVTTIKYKFSMSRA